MGPSFQVLEYAGVFAEFETVTPPKHVGAKLFDHRLNANSACSALAAQPLDLQPESSMNMSLSVIARSPDSVCLMSSFCSPAHALLHASLGHALTRQVPLRFATPSPPSGYRGDLHPKAGEHAQHAVRRAAFRATLSVFSTLTSPGRKLLCGSAICLPSRCQEPAGPTPPPPGW